MFYFPYDLGSYLSLTVTNRPASIGDRANLHFPVTRISKMSCLSFAYNLPSQTSGGIEVFQTDILTNNAKLLTLLSGYYGKRWRQAQVQIFPSEDLLKV